MEENGRVRFYRKAMLVFGLIFLVAGFQFLVLPDQTLGLVNLTAKLTDGARPAPRISDLSASIVWDATQGQETRPRFVDQGEQTMPAPRLWAILSFTMMMMITLICLLNAASPARFIGWVPLLLFSKLCSSVTGLIVYSASQMRYVSDISIFFVDFPLFLIIGIIYLVCRSAVLEPA